MAANKSLLMLLKNRLPSVQALRTIYNAEALGIPAYQEARTNTATQYSAEVIVNRFKDRMKEYTKPETKASLFTDDLKTLIHVANDSSNDLELVHNAFKRYHNQKSKAEFHFGPLVMRYYYLMEKPVEALKAFCDPQLDGMFNDFASFKILLGVLYEHNMHDELLAVFDVLKAKKQDNLSAQRSLSVFVIASCYKKNTPESLKTVAEILKNPDLVTRRTMVMGAALAVRQNNPSLALEYLELKEVEQPNVSYRNVKVMGFCGVDRPEEAIGLVKKCLFRNIRVLLVPEALQALRDAVDRVKEENQKDILISELKSMEADLKEKNFLTEKSLDEYVLTAIRPFNKDQSRDQKRPNRNQKKEDGSDSDSD